MIVLAIGLAIALALTILRGLLATLILLCRLIRWLCGDGDRRRKMRRLKRELAQLQRRR